MPPKKREKDVDCTKNPRMEHINADHELFLQAFEKPTQIYRYLRTRNMCSPIYLNRTLSYMKHRMSRSNKLRINFKIDSILDRVSRQQATAGQHRFMTIQFFGFHDKTLDANVPSVVVEVFVLKISYKKRKDSSSHVQQLSAGSVEINTNPEDNNLPTLVPSINIPADSFSLSRGPLAKSTILLLRVRCLCTNSDVVDDEPLNKRRKSMQNLNNRVCEDTKLYGSELIVYDKQNRCLLTDGDYEVSLQEFTNTNKLSPKKRIGWENAADILDANNMPLEGPYVKFRLTWSQEPLNRLVERPSTFVMGENKENLAVAANNTSSQQEKLQIIYQFVYNNNSRQQTEACEDCHCPWCSLNCNTLYTLLKHLKSCHSRFTFTYVPISLGARIDVAINELYDGSYTGSPQDLIIQPAIGAFSSSGSSRRASVTNILVCHPKRTIKPSLSEFLEQEDCDYDGQRPFITGHNRLYHHTTTCLPIYPKEMDVDSEGENDPEWLQAKTKMMIDDFTDVNEGEKELMKMWNLHVMKYGFVGDCQILPACSIFIRQKGEELLLKNLHRNFVVHLSGLVDFGLLSAAGFYQITQKLQQLIEDKHEICTGLRESLKAQADSCLNSTTTSNERNEKCKTPSGRKVGSMGIQRRKATPTTPVEPVTRRKSFAGEAHKKRLSLSLGKMEQKASGS